MSVANSLILQTSQSQQAQINALSDQIAALTTSVSNNALGVATNLTSITALAFANEQEFIVKDLPPTALVYNSGDVETLFEDPPEVGVSGRYVFKICGLIQCASDPIRGIVTFENTAAGPSYEYFAETTGSNEVAFSYTGFLEYIVGDPLPKISISGIMASGLWGYAEMSLTFYRIQKILPPPNP